MNSLEEKLKKAPNLSGVYIFKDEQGKILYIGKACHLSSRVKTYLSTSFFQPLTKNIADVEYLITDSEIEALILEDSLIKKYQPKYNVKLRDDKQYPFLRISNEKYPNFSFTRHKYQDGAKYFGPYTNTIALRKTMDLLRSVFGIRTCKKKLDELNNKVCLNYHIKRCSAPCAGYITPKKYHKNVCEMILSLHGHFNKLIFSLKNQMNALTKKLEFEECAEIRDRINALLKVIEKQKIVLKTPENIDIIGLVQDGKDIAIELFFIREGRLLDQKFFLLTSRLEISCQQILINFIQQYYNDILDIPSTIVISYKLKEEQLLLQWLKEKKKSKIKFQVPKKGKLKKLLSLAEKNARLKLVQTKIEEKFNLTDELMKILKVSKPIRKIEAFDISNILGKNAVGAMVVFKDGIPLKNEYRKYQIKFLKNPDDYAMMREIIRRRYTVTEELPDLVLIDGGKGHLNVVTTTLKEINRDTLVISLAKEFEHIYALPDKKIILKRTSPCLKYLQRIRDEAHRFAIKYHKRLREKEFDASILDTIPQIGKIRKKMLLCHFGSIEKIKLATISEIEQIKGISKKLAKMLKKTLE